MARPLLLAVGAACLLGENDAFHAGIPLGISQRYLATRSGVHCTAMNAASAPRPALAKRFVQHKQEAKTFYRFLSIVYDTIVNPGHWTSEMRDDALEPAKLGWHDLDVVDVGAGCVPPSPSPHLLLQHPPRSSGDPPPPPLPRGTRPTINLAPPPLPPIRCPLHPASRASRTQKSCPTPPPSPLLSNDPPALAESSPPPSALPGPASARLASSRRA